MFFFQCNLWLDTRNVSLHRSRPIFNFGLGCEGDSMKSRTITFVFFRHKITPMFVHKTCFLNWVSKNGESKRKISSNFLFYFDLFCLEIMVHFLWYFVWLFGRSISGSLCNICGPFLAVNHMTCRLISCSLCDFLVHFLWFTVWSGGLFLVVYCVICCSTCIDPSVITIENKSTMVSVLSVHFA